VEALAHDRRDIRRTRQKAIDSSYLADLATGGATVMRVTVLRADIR
jgi:hypothetical protein